MSTPEEKTNSLEKRPAHTVMRLNRMGSFHASRLSFMRVLLRRLKAGSWKFDRPVFDLNDRGVGVATYRAIGPKNTYTLVAFSHDLPAELRSDRVIAEAWDSTFALVDGEVDESDIERLSKNVPLQEAGRISEREIVLSRANKSVRLFEYVSNCLSKGLQPEISEIEKVGYLMRTTAVYGSGKFGAADRAKWAARQEFAGSFQPELLAVWLIRTFAIDLVEHAARIAAPDTAVSLEPDVRRRFGVGNSTGLGMAPFLINHPALIHAWIDARETALAMVLAVEKANPLQIDRFKGLVERAALNAETWNTSHPYQMEKVDGLRQDFKKIRNILASEILARPYPWQAMHDWAVNELTLEGQEQLISLMLEPYGELIDHLADQMSANEQDRFRIDGQMDLEAFKELAAKIYGWADAVNFQEKHTHARVWYVSEEKLEPRLGERYEEEIEPYEQPLCPGRDAKRMLNTLENWNGGNSLAEFLMKHPEHRHIVRRIQIIANKPYGEICDNTIASDMLPIDLLRCKLSFFGATKFDPRSDRWVRITMYQGAPFPDELATSDPDDLAYPALEVNA